MNTTEESTREFQLKSTAELNMIRHEEANLALLMYLRDLKELKASIESSVEGYTSKRFKRAVRELQERYRRKFGK